MDYMRLGLTDLKVSPVSFGTGSLGEFFGPLPEPDAIRLVHEAIDLGINVIDTSRYYGNAEARLGRALTDGKRNHVILATKAGRYGGDDFDFTAAGIRRGIEESLKLLQTEHVDILHMHDIEFADLGVVFTEGYGELLRIRDEGKCRYIGVTGYPMATMKRALIELEIDVLLTYAKGNLLDNAIHDELVPLAAGKGVGLMNAAALVAGILSPGGTKLQDHPAGPAIRQAASKMVTFCTEHGVNSAFVANQYAIQRSGCPTTVVGVGKSSHLHSAVEAATTPINEAFLAELLAFRPPVGERQWRSGLPENN